MKAIAPLLSVALLASVSCGQVPRANLPGESAPPTQSPPPLTVAPTTAARTSAPTTTARRNFKISEPVAFADGWRLTVLKIEDQAFTSVLFTPKPGVHLVAVTVRHDNGSTAAVYVNPFFFKLQDSAGIRHDITIGGRDDRLGSGEVAPGAFVVGSLMFEVPVGDAKLQLIYQQTGYAQTTFELY